MSAGPPFIYQPPPANGPPFNPMPPPGPPMIPYAPQGPSMAAATVPPGYTPPIPPYDPSHDSKAMGTHPEYPEAARYKFTGKKLAGLVIALLTAGFTGGMIFMFYLYPIAFTIVKAIQGVV